MAPGAGKSYQSETYSLLTLPMMDSALILMKGWRGSDPLEVVQKRAPLGIESLTRSYSTVAGRRYSAYSIFSRMRWSTLSIVSNATLAISLCYCLFVGFLYDHRN